MFSVSVHSHKEGGESSENFSGSETKELEQPVLGDESGVLEASQRCDVIAGAAADWGVAFRQCELGHRLNDVGPEAFPAGGGSYQHAHVHGRTALDNRGLDAHAKKAGFVSHRVDRVPFHGESKTFSCIEELRLVNFEQCRSGGRGVGEFREANLS